MSVFSYRLPFHSRGITLIELMVALAISLVLFVGITQIFITNKRAYRIQDTNTHMLDNGRFAYGLIMSDLRRAGYYGGNANLDDIEGTTGVAANAVSCATGDTTWGSMLGLRVFGLNGATTAEYACILAADHIAGTDILTVRFAEGTPTTAYTADDDGRLFVRSSLFAGAVFTGALEDETDNPLNLVDDPPVTDHMLSAHAYYISNSARACSSDATIDVPALWRETLDSAGQPVGQELARGIESLQVQYGVDRDDDGVVEQYLDAGGIALAGATTWAQVTAVRFWLLARSDCPQAGYENINTYTMGDVVVDPNPNDSFKRQLYTSTVALRNRGSEL